MSELYRKKNLFGKWFIVLLEIILLWAVQSDASGGTYSIQQAIHHAQEFLAKAVREDRDYLGCRSTQAHACVLPKGGKILADYFIVLALGHNLPRTAYIKIKNQILKERRNKLWSYSLNSPVDADDTSFAMQTAAMLDIPFDVSSLEIFYKKEINGYATFNSNMEGFSTCFVSALGNFGIHPEVNANIDGLFYRLYLGGKINYSLIKKSQTKMGYWCSYFYPGEYYSTYLNLRLLCATGKLQKQKDQGIQFVMASQNKDGSWGRRGNAYDTALALNSLLACGFSKEKQVQHGVHYLLSQQASQGFWETNNVIWSYFYQAPLGKKWVAYDTEHVITTALVVRALTDYLNKNKVN